MNRNAVVLFLRCCLILVGLIGVALSQEKPAPTTDDANSKNSSVIISIPTDTEFYFGKDKITWGKIPERVRQEFKDKSPDEQLVYIKAHRFVKYGTVVSVIDAVREAGCDRIGLVTEKQPGGDESPRAKAKPPAAGKDLPPRTAPEQSQRAALPVASDLVFIDVKAKSRIRINSKPVPLAGLQIALEKLFQGRSEKAVFIIAPKNMAYGEVVTVIDIAKAAGAQSIGLQVNYLN